MKFDYNLYISTLDKHILVVETVIEELPVFMFITREILSNSLNSMNQMKNNLIEMKKAGDN